VTRQRGDAMKTAIPFSGGVVLWGGASFLSPSPRSLCKPIHGNKFGSLARQFTSRESKQGGNSAYSALPWAPSEHNFADRISPTSFPAASYRDTRWRNGFRACAFVETHQQGVRSSSTDVRGG
jgi:hypothetical protein